MRKVVLLVRRGPLQGHRIELELGRAAIGREPGPGGVLLSGDSLLSRLHGELREEGDRILYRNLSTNGSLVDGRVAEGDMALKPGSELRLGNEYLLEVQYRSAPRPAGPEKQVGDAPLWKSGPLAKPAVRAVLAVYLLFICGIAVFLAIRGEPTLADELKPVREKYLASYRPPGLSAEERQARLAQADRLVDELLASERAEAWERARALCRDMMAVDRDPASPLYRFAARRLGALADKR